MVVEKPRLLYTAESNRRPYIRRFFWMLLATVAAVAALIALEEAQARGESINEVLNVGTFVAILTAGLLFFRMMLNLIRAIFTRTQSVKVFDRGFIWQRNDDEYKYSWPQVRAFKEGARVIRLFGRPLLVLGSHTLTTRDDKDFRFSAKMGNPETFAQVIRPHLADATGSAIGRALRNNKIVKVHPKLIVHTQGLVVDNQKIPWSKVDIRRKGNQLEILRHNGRDFKSVGKFNTSDVENVGGFLDIADSLIRNHQPERFNIPAQRM
jgi:hypothetical protein